VDEQGRGYEAPVKCLTCPRERRADEPGWHYLDVPDRMHASGPLRVYVCPRHYGHFAGFERARWSILVDPQPAAAPPVEEWPAPLPVAAVAAAGEGIASE
jgi:hypothetical protein